MYLLKKLKSLIALCAGILAILVLSIVCFKQDSNSYFSRYSISFNAVLSEQYQKTINEDFKSSSFNEEVCETLATDEKYDHDHPFDISKCAYSWTLTSNKYSLLQAKYYDDSSVNLFPIITATSKVANQRIRSLLPTEVKMSSFVDNERYFTDANKSLDIICMVLIILVSSGLALIVLLPYTYNYFKNRRKEEKC